MPEVMVWVTRNTQGEAPDLKSLGDRVEGLEHVSDVNVESAGSVLNVFYEGGEAEQEEIESTIREAGYEIFKTSRRET